MHGDEHVARSSDRQVSSWSASDRSDECCNQFHYLVRTGVDLLNPWSEDCSSEAAVTQFGDEKANQMGPRTPVLRSALKSPRAITAGALSPASTKQVTFKTTAVADSQQGSGNLTPPLTPTKMLQKLHRFRIQDFDVSKIIDPSLNMTAEY